MIDFSKFTEIARQAVKKAYQIAQESHYASIEPQIMMVALMQEGRDMVYYILQKLNVDKTAFFQAIGDSILELEHQNIVHPDISPVLNNVFIKAQQLSDSSDCPVVALEHIFWAFGCVNSPIKDIMISFGITEEELRNSVASFRNGSEIEDEEETATIDNDTLNRFATNLIKEADEGRIEASIGRDQEIRRILQILSRKTKNNPMLVGAPGTGKTAILEGLAHRILRGDVPLDLRGIQIYSLDITALTAGAMPGEFEERLKKVIEDVKRSPNVVLFVDEIHLLIGTGHGAMNAANILKPALARGEMKIIGATTIDEYRKYIESDKAFERRFQKIQVDEPDIETAITIMRGIKSRFERFHRIKILDEAIVSSVKLSDRYINDRFLPDKAIDVLDEAASRMRIERSSVPVELDELSRLIRSKEMERESIRQDELGTDLTALNIEIENLREKENVMSAKWRNERQKFEELQSLQDTLVSFEEQYNSAEQIGQYDDALRLRNQMDVTKCAISSLLTDIENDNSMMLKAYLDEDDIRQVITSWTGIPISKMNEDESEKLLALEDTLHNSVIGQQEAVHVVSEVIRRNRMGFGDPNRPIGSFLFLGTTGVGKTELSKALADYLFDSRDMIVRVDMSEYQQEHSVARLFGAPPGYVGFDQGGQLTEAVRLKPYSVILLDEVEKAHKKVFETLLQVLDDGRMTDGQGHTVNFKNTIIIMTSNMGAEELSQAIDTSGNLQNEDVLKHSIIAMMKQRISPEFVNRVDEIVMFKPLNKTDILHIVKLQINQLKNKLLTNDISIDVTNEAIAALTILGYEPSMGARPVKRAINDKILNGLTQALLIHKVNKNTSIKVDYSGTEFTFTN